MSGKINYIKAENYEKEVLEGGIVALDFYSTECPPCEALAAKFEPLSEIYGDDVKFLKIFRQENRKLAESLNITGSPTLLFYKNGEIVGERLSGGIKRTDIIKNIESLIGRKRAEELASRIKPVVTETDVAILGAGPAGLTAGIYSAQAKLDTTVIDIGLAGGQVSTTHQVSNYPGFIDPVQGFMLTHFMGEQAANAGIKTRYAVDINSVDFEKKEIVVDGFETIKAKKIIVASGSSYKPLGVPGEKEYRGNGISYCATCDAKYFTDREVVVIGGGNSAIEEALFITKFASKVTIVHQFDELQANKAAQEKAFTNKKIEFQFAHEPREFIKTDRGMDVVVEDLKSGECRTLSTDGVFIFAGMQPNISAFSDVEFDLDEWGYIRTDEFQLTNLKDIYAAGDVASKPFRQITVAVAEGSVAAIHCSKELDKQ